VLMQHFQTRSVHVVKHLDVANVIARDELALAVIKDERRDGTTGDVTMHPHKLATRRVPNLHICSTRRDKRGAGWVVHREGNWTETRGHECVKHIRSTYPTTL
jgi:hypothetical protein